jgi:hypothetical protein
VAKQRIVNTKFWDDSYIAGLTSIEKLLFLYLITNPLTNISGVYELPLRRAAFDVGLSVEEVEKVFGRFEADGKIARFGAWVGVTNFIKHQTLNPKIKVGILHELNRAPKEVVDSLSIDYQSLSHPNPNLIPNRDSNALSFGKFSREEAEEIRRKKEALARQWSLRR